MSIKNVLEPAFAQLTRRRTLQLLATAPILPMISGCSGAASGSSTTPPVNPAPGTPTVATAGSAVSIPYPLYGLNTGDNLSSHMSDTGFLPAVTQLGPSIMRYPGGNSAGWFDISTGSLLTNPTYAPVSEVLSFNSPAFTFSVLSQILTAASGKATIVLNLLQGNMASQVAALQAAASIVPIERVELGNELYLSGLSGLNQYQTTFPTTASYATTANAYAKAIKTVLPLAKIGVCADTTPSGSSSRETNWNSQLLPLLQGIDAIICHDYQNPASKPFTGSSASSDNAALAAPGGPPSIFQEAVTARTQIQAAAATFNGFEVWVTETNLRDTVGGIAGTWAHGLYVAYMQLLLLEVPSIKQALIHALHSGSEYEESHASSGSFPGSTVAYAQNGLSASGYTSLFVFRAARNNTTAQPLNFNENPSQVAASGGTSTSLYGWTFGNNATCVLLNLSPDTYSASFNSSTLFNGTAYQQLSGSPAGYVGTVTGLTTTSGTYSPSTGISLPPYSITYIGS